MKVQASIQGGVVRVNGAKRDVLQEVIAFVEKNVTDFHCNLATLETKSHF